MAGRVIQCSFMPGHLSDRGHRAFPLQAAHSSARTPGDSIEPQRLGLVRTGGQSLPSAVLAKMESAFNADFSQVRVHSGPQAGRLGAVAFTIGNDLYFAPGMYQPNSTQGQRLIGHELAHVIQQRQGRVKANGSGISLVVDQALEAEADRLGLRAALHVQAKSANIPQRNTGHPGNRALLIQRKTAISFSPADDKAGSLKIGSVAHQRELHNGTQRTLAAYLSGYSTPPALTCNHHIPYSLIRSEVERKLTSAANLDAAVQWMNGLALPGAQVFDWNNWGWTLPSNSQFQVGAMPKPSIQPTKTTAGTKYYAEANLNVEVNDLIWNLANDPRNLFYWPATTGDANGTAIDNPTGSGPMNISHVKTRLQAYRTVLQGLGLNV